MFDSAHIDKVSGATAYDANGDKIGKVDQAYLDDETAEPTWVSINTGFFGTSTSLVPLEGARFDGEDLHVAHSKDKVKDAPRVDADQHLSREEERELYSYYGLSYSDWDGGTDTSRTAGTTTGTAGTTTGTAGTTGREVDDQASVTRSEERLNVGTESQEVGRARLRKYTTTEEQQVTVPVTQERLTVERTPVDGDAQPGGITDGDSVEEDIVLREERPVVEKETVAVEEVRVGKEQVTDQADVSESVRKEHVEVDGEGDTRDRR